MYCRMKQTDETCTFIKDHVKKSIKSHCLNILIYCINSLRGLSSEEYKGVSVIGVYGMNVYVCVCIHK